MASAEDITEGKNNSENHADDGISISYKVFEDNNGALEMANKPKFRPRTKHIGIKYHHFRDRVRCGKFRGTIFGYKWTNCWYLY